MNRNPKLNVWARGNETNPKKVIDALLRLGANNIYCEHGRNPDNVYYIDLSNGIAHSDVNSIFGWCLMHSYKELRLDFNITDKQLVWCWDDDDAVGRNIRFYDAKNNCTFDLYGKRNGWKYKNYKPYEDEWPEWAKKALEELD